MQNSHGNKIDNIGHCLCPFINQVPEMQFLKADNDSPVC